MEPRSRAVQPCPSGIHELANAQPSRGGRSSPSLESTSRWWIEAISWWGLFRAKFVRPTGVADSGTEEEIRRGIQKRKEVLVYFASLPKPKRPKGRGELARIEAFKRKYGQQALYHVIHR